MSIFEVQSRFHRKALEVRAVDTFLYTERFEEAYEEANKEQREHLQQVILKSNSLFRARLWVKDRLQGPLRLSSYRQLRKLAQSENIPRWSRLGRDELLEALEKLNARSME